MVMGSTKILRATQCGYPLFASALLEPNGAAVFFSLVLLAVLTDFRSFLRSSRRSLKSSGPIHLTKGPQRPASKAVDELT